MSKTIVFGGVLAAASFIGSLALYRSFGRKRTGSSFREVYEDNR